MALDSISSLAPVPSLLREIPRFRWFAPTSEADPASLQSCVNAHVKALDRTGVTPLPVRIVDSWQEAEARAWGVTRAGRWRTDYEAAAKDAQLGYRDPGHAAQIRAWVDAETVARASAMIGASTTWPISSRPRWAVAKSAAEWGAWTLGLHAKHLAGSSNPSAWAPLVAIYARGGWPIGPDDEAYVIYWRKNGEAPGCFGR